MQIIQGLGSNDITLHGSVVTIGNFDGVHRGHGEIFRHVRRTAGERSAPSVVVTFDPHPLKVLAPETAPLLLTTLSQKCELIAAYGIDYLWIIPFSSEFSRISARDFVVDRICRQLGMGHIIIGHDYAFGRNRQGNFTTLQELGQQNGFTVEDLPPIGEGDIIFSSSQVRAAIAGGEMESAARMLGRQYQLQGTVSKGRQLGQTIGFPTANIASANELIPADGVYAVMVEVRGGLYKGACNIGCNPTVGGNARTVEVFILDFSGDLYDRNISVQFISRLRPVEKFSDITALKQAIGRDVATVRTILEDTNNITTGTVCALESI